ncbi:LOW QUALITY PROTEIN: uncharacterized protein LOC128263408 [Drosophila gunungcola]|nr:LOW QUALITY PROTEIN: uncharacterized protein LOC128263408 [Drosophila gunungcola]
MFRFYKLYSLYMSNMASGLTRQQEWCLCEKLPRAVLHIPVNRHLVCEVCGLARRPQDSAHSSSDEEAELAANRQRFLLEQRRTEEDKKSEVKAKKPNARASCRMNCVKCGGLSRPEGGQTRNGDPKHVKSKLYSVRHGFHSKPKRMLPRREKQEPSAPPPPMEWKPPPPPAPPPPPPPPPPASRLPWKEMPNLVKQDVFSQKNHILQSYSNLFVSNFIPLNTPITNGLGGAISKRSSYSSRPPLCHRSRPLPPLAQVRSNILASSQKSLEDREKGGSSSPQTSKDSLDADSDLASQFCPFDQYEGPSEDALVVNSARYLLHRPKSLYIEPRRDLRNNRIEALELELRSGCGSPAPSPPKVPVNPENDSPPDVQRPCFFMTKLVQQNLMKKINEIEFDCSSESGSLSSHTSNPSIIQQTQQGNAEQETGNLGNLDRQAAERSAIIASIWDQLIRSQASKSSAENSENDKGPELDQFPNHDNEDHGTSSFLSDVSTDQSLLSSNKTKHDQDYSKRFSTTLSSSSGERDFDRISDSSPNTTGKTIFSVKDKPNSILLKCSRCGNHRNVIQNAEYDTIKMKRDIIPKETDDINRTCLNIKLRNAIRHKLENLRTEKKKCSTMEDYEEGMNNDKHTTSIQTIFQRNFALVCHSQRSSSPTHCNNHQCAKNLPSILQTDKKKLESKVKPYNNSLIINTEHVPNISPTVLENKDEAKALPVDSVGLYRHKIQSISWAVVKNFETVAYMCAEIPKLRIATFVKDTKVVKGYIMESYVTNRPSLSLYEFRRPDIDPSELVSHSDKEGNVNDDSGPETPIAHITTPKRLSRSTKQRKNRKKPRLPVWPAHPLKYRSRKIKYEELEIAFDMQQNEILLDHQKKVLIFKNERVTNIYDAQQFSQSDMFCDMSTEEETKSNPINIIKGDQLFVNNSDSFVDSESLENKNTLSTEPKKESLNTRPLNLCVRKFNKNPINGNNETKDQNKISQVNPTKVSDNIRKRIDNALQLKLKKMMSKPIKLLGSTESSSVSKFLEPFTNKLAGTEEKELNSLRNSIALSSTKRGTKITTNSSDMTTVEKTVGGIDNAALSSASKDISELGARKLRKPIVNSDSKPNASCQKPLRLITNLENSTSSSEESKYVSMESRFHTRNIEDFKKVW